MRREKTDARFLSTADLHLGRTCPGDLSRYERISLWSSSPPSFPALFSPKSSYAGPSTTHDCVSSIVLVDAARGDAEALDREFNGTVRVLQTLAQSPLLDTGDVTSFCTKPVTVAALLDRIASFDTLESGVSS